MRQRAWWSCCIMAAAASFLCLETLGWHMRQVASEDNSDRLTGCRLCCHYCRHYCR